jgi:phospholipid/cholesterol/gamma-HCH transport system ATP-binding protein
VSDSIIVVDNVIKRFAGRAVLNGVSFTVQSGETLAVLGRSGTGKSVLLKNIIALMDPDEGEIQVLGKSMHALSERDRLHARKDLGYVFQGSALFDSLTVQENVGFTLYQARTDEDEIRKRVLERLEMVGLAHTIDQYPSELSGGMQKRVGLARAIINLPSVVLYDEPTTGLDPVTTDVINQIILRLRSRMRVTSIVVTHDVKSAFTISDRIIMLDQGRIVAQGTPQEIQNSDNVWVQHFIHGRALDNERIDSKVFPQRSTVRLARRESDGGTIRLKSGSVSGSRPTLASAVESPQPRPLPDEPGSMSSSEYPLQDSTLPENQENRPPGKRETTSLITREVKNKDQAAPDESAQD